jgi:5,10-methylene-tetrahydrofolate dehydrogenase/methenyl tetrahydrofolate cyclohydrolase
LRKSEQNITSPEHVVVGPEERARFLTELHRKTFAQAEIPSEVSRLVTKEKATRASANTDLKGAAVLVQQPKPEEQQQRVAAMEQQLLESIPVEDSDLQALASERARQVQLYLIQSGKVEAERVYLAQSGDQSESNKGSRVYLQLH